MKKNNGILITLVVIFSAMALIFAILFLSTITNSKIYKNQLENTYQKSYYEMVSTVNDLEVDMSKLIATTSLDSQRELLGGIYNTCSIGIENINQLPISWDKMSEINNLFNKTGGFAYSLLLDNYKGNAISQDDFLQINDLHTRIKEMQYDINIYSRSLSLDYSILDDVDFGNTSSGFSAGLINNETSNSKVPTLIYDGPFSDSVLNKEIKGLSSNIISREEVEEKLSNLFTGFAIYYTGDTMGKFETYNFEVQGDVTLNIGVTKRDGFIISINSFGGGNTTKINTAEGIDLAESFAKDVGLENMYSVWQQQSGNVLYVNLAPIVNKVIYYSDLVKVKVDLSTGLVIGWEATNYATNHIDRKFESSIGLLTAENKINPLLKIVERNLTIIPDKYVGEINAYEFICNWKDYSYYIYINAVTGNEVNILRVVKTSNGELLI